MVSFFHLIFCHLFVYDCYLKVLAGCPHGFFVNKYRYIFNIFFFYMYEYFIDANSKENLLEIKNIPNIHVFIYFF